MTNPYPANFETLEGTRRLTGQVNFTDATNQPGGGLTIPADVTGGDTRFILNNDGSAELRALGTADSLLQLTEVQSAAKVSIESDSGINANGDFTSIGAANLAGTAGVSIAPNGVFIGVNAAPADGAIPAGYAVLWFDATNGVGNTKLMVKGKSADGTVKTASIVLA